MILGTRTPNWRAEFRWWHPQMGLDRLKSRGYYVANIRGINVLRAAWLRDTGGGYGCCDL